MHHETAVAVADLAFGARKRKIERKPLHRKVNHAECLAHQIRAAMFRKNGHQRILRHVVDFDIVIAARLSQKGIADPAAYQKSAATGLANLACNFEEASRQIRLEPFSRKRLDFCHRFNPPYSNEPASAADVSAAAPLVASDADVSAAVVAALSAPFTPL